MKKYLQIFNIIIVTSLLAMGMHTHANAASASSTNLKSMRVAAVDLSQVLPYIMGAGDVFQGYESVIYRNVQALRLRIFNQNSGRVRYIFVDARTGRIL